MVVFHLWSVGPITETAGEKEQMSTRIDDVQRLDRSKLNHVNITKINFENTVFKIYHVPEVVLVNLNKQISDRY